MTADSTASASVRSTSLTTAAGVTWILRTDAEPPEPFTAIGGVVHPATVPGEVHTDLLASGLIPDPFDGANETELAWIGRSDWTYEGVFEWAGGNEERHDLVASTLDTAATITLNGSEVATTANQHRTYRFEVGALLVEGTNTLRVRFEAPVNAAERLAAEIGERPHTNVHPYNAIRKMASAYGWDWGPDLAGAGILSELRIESWSTVRLASVRPLAGVDSTAGTGGNGSTAGTGGNDSTAGTLEVHADLEWSDDAPAGAAVLRVAVAGQEVDVDVPAGADSVTTTVVVPDVDLWWPVGYGEPTLYPATLTLHADDVALGSWDGRVGFRTVTLSTAPDVDGTEFVISVNHTPIYVKGANWIPDDALMSRLTRKTYTTSIDQAVAAGMNLLRVWGGGIYEREEFYDHCDELGLLVWQDFLFACAAYSEDEPLRSEVEAEAREAITRLSSHASLVLWNGNNENIWGYVDWGWRTELAGRSWGNGFYTELLPSLVAELDPRTPYSPGSPFSYADYYHPNDPSNGTMHAWDVWNGADYSVYRSHPARFVSEFGFQGPAAWSTLSSVVHDEPADPYGPQLLVHQKAGDGNLKLERGLGDHLPLWGFAVTPTGADERPVAEMDDWHWLTSLNQARAVAYGISHFRSLYPLNRGAIVWQLNDNWPVISWAAVDGHGIRKPLWHALKAAYAPRFLSVQPRPDASGTDVSTVFAHNDTDSVWEGEVVITRRSTGAGTPELAVQRETVRIAPRSGSSIVLSDDVTGSDRAELGAASPADGANQFLQVTAPDAAAAFWFFVEDPALGLVAPTEAYETTVEATDDGAHLTVTAHALVKDLTLFPDRLDAAARVDTALITLVDGESHVFTVTGATVDADALSTRPVLRSVNDVIAR